MKKIFTFLIVFVTVIGCKNNTEAGAQEPAAGDNPEQKKMSKRDYSINKSNSYSDLFLDSMALEKFIAGKKIDDTLARRLRSFYNTRNYQYAWFASDGVTEQGRSFWNLHEYYTTYSHDNSLDDKDLKKRVNGLVAEESLKLSNNAGLANTELTLTQHFIQYILNNYKGGEIKRKEMERFVPFKKEDAMYLADSLLTKKHKDNKYYGDVNPNYKALQDQLQKYYDIAKKGGWQAINTTEKTIKPGSASPAVMAIKRRLELTGELAPGDTTAVYSPKLEEAVKTFQISRGLKPTGIVTTALIKEMNVPAEKRIQQILLNMSRMRWLLTPTGGNLILVNIPEFVLHVFESGKEAWRMDVVVGKEGHNTTIFTGNLNQIVFSPYWNPTPSIISKEILPAMSKDPDYLARNNMEVIGNEGGLPKIRQLPGPTNSLGKVKFLFPNSYDIYLHDTPAKSLFNRDKRAFSHGCIRLSDPERLATYLLRNQSEWTPDKIFDAMNSNQEQFVKLKNPVPVLITYYTSWVDENGILNFRDDIYAHDSTLLRKRFANPM